MIGYIDAMIDVFSLEYIRVCIGFAGKRTDRSGCCTCGDFKKSAELQLKYLELCNALFMDVNPIPVKVAMRMMGFDVGPLRLPLCDMSEEKTEHLRKVLAKYGLIK